MSWAKDGQLVAGIVEDMRKKGHSVSPEAVANALKTTSPTTVRAAMEAVIQASRSVGHAVAVIEAREAERKQEQELAAFERDLSERGEVAMLNDAGDVVGFAGAPYFKQSPAEKPAATPDPEPQLKARQQELQQILDNPATPVLARYRAEQEMADVTRKLEMIDALKPRDTGM